MENPGLRTLMTFLEQVGRLQPATFSAISAERNRAYGMVTRYLGYCLEKGLIKVVDERQTRGRYPSKAYALTDRGAGLLAIFAHLPEDLERQN